MLLCLFVVVCFFFDFAYLRVPFVKRNMHGDASYLSACMKHFFALVLSLEWLSTSVFF